jgi:hypothetical protein
VLSGRGLGDGLITRPKKSYRLCCVVVCDLENSRMRRPLPALGRSARENEKIICLELVAFKNRTASSGNFLPTFWDNLTVPSSAGQIANNIRDCQQISGKEDTLLVT